MTKTEVEAAELPGAPGSEAPRTPGELAFVGRQEAVGEVDGTDRAQVAGENAVDGRARGWRRSSGRVLMRSSLPGKGVCMSSWLFLKRKEAITLLEI